MSDVKLNNLLQEAEGFYELELYDKSMERLDEYESLGGDRAASLPMRGECLRAGEKYDEALGVFEEASRLAPKDMGVYMGLGWCYKRTGQLERAVKALEDAVDVDPDSALARYNLACYYSLAGRRAASLELLSTAIKRNGSYAEMARTESDFETVRNVEEFRKLTGEDEKCQK